MISDLSGMPWPFNNIPVFKVEMFFKNKIFEFCLTCVFKTVVLDCCNKLAKVLV